MLGPGEASHGVPRRAGHLLREQVGRSGGNAGDELADAGVAVGEVGARVQAMRSPEQVDLEGRGNDFGVRVEGAQTLRVGIKLGHAVDPGYRPAQQRDEGFVVEHRRVAVPLGEEGVRMAVEGDADGVPEGGLPVEGRFQVADAGPGRELAGVDVLGTEVELRLAGEMELAGAEEGVCRDGPLRRRLCGFLRARSEGADGRRGGRHVDDGTGSVLVRR